MAPIPPEPTRPTVNGHLTNGHPNGDSSSSPLTERLQIVNDEKVFTPDLTYQIERWGLRDAGFDYNLVAVFGSQSTGKSTLLNRLFGTTFDVMDETKRQQTTKGIWMCRGKDMNLMVMDVEGTDGRERGEDQDFERKSALFSLASSEILIVNLWEYQVGLYQGANMGLLKTVFEVNLGLFGKKGQDGRTLLLFVIRDHLGGTPLANLQSTLTADLTRIWDNLSKPADLKDSKLSDYFDIVFTALPHKILAPEKFEQEVIKLRGRFVDKANEAYLFKPAYHKRIPADGVAFYMEGIWEQVQTNKDLDLPTQQELLAQFRCDEISAIALSEFNEQAKSQKRPVESGRVVDGLGAMMRNWRTDSLTRYDRDASRYHKGVYTRKRADLLTSLDAVLSPLFLGQLKNLHRQCLVLFKQELRDALQGDGYNFADVVSAADERCIRTFTNGAVEAHIKDTDWLWEDELQTLREDTRAVADQCRKDEVKKMLNLIERNFKKQISEPVELTLGKASSEMWDHVLKIFKDVLHKAESVYLTKAKSFNCTESEQTTSLATLRKRAWLSLRAKVDEQTADPVILNQLRAHFEERFRYDESGVPRVWKPEDDIDSAFKKAKDKSLELVPLYAKIAPIDPTLEYTLPSDAPTDSLSNEGDDFDFPSTLVVFTETKQLELMSKFRRDADAYYVEAKRSTVASIAQIPYWMYGMLVVLGWNEAMAVLFNPMYFTLLIIMVATTYVVIKLGLSGPVYAIGLKITQEIKNQAVAKLRQHFGQPALTEPVRISRPRTLDEEGEELKQRR